jgi:cbb3-type cytochrome oxidase subunit 3
VFFNLANDWPVLIFIALFVGFIVYAWLNGKRNAQKEKQDQGK